MGADHQQEVFEAIVMQWFNDDFDDKIDVKQFGCIAETSTTDTLMEMLHRWYEATDVCGTYNFYHDNFVRL